MFSGNTSGEGGGNCILDMLFLKLDNKNTCPSNGIKCCIPKRYVTNRKIQNIYLYFHWINFKRNIQKIFAIKN